MMESQADLLNDGKTIESVDEKLYSFSSDEPEEMYSSSALDTCRVRDKAPKERYLKMLDFRGGNEESSAEASDCKASDYAEFDDCARAEKFLKLLSFRHFERHILFSQSERKSKKKAISDGVNVSVVIKL